MMIYYNDPPANILFEHVFAQVEAYSKWLVVHPATVASDEESRKDARSIHRIEATSFFYF